MGLNIMNFKKLSKDDVLFPKSIKEYFGNKKYNDLYYLGNIELLKKRKIAFSGSRNCSEKGLSIAKDVVEQLVEYDIVFVSGGAKGLDHEVHLTALENNGQTIFVLPEGINHFKPKKELKKFWDFKGIWDNVLIISPFNPDDVWKSYRAMQRNDYILSLSDALFAVEAGEKGGTLDAGQKALKKGMPTFTVNYQMFEDSCVGNKFLLSQGAKPIQKNIKTNRANLNTLLLDSERYSHKYVYQKEFGI